MSDDLERLANLIYQKFKNGLGKEILKEEKQIASDSAKRGKGGWLISKIMDLHFDEIKRLYEKRIEIEKKLLLDKYGRLPDPEMKTLREKVTEIINGHIESLKKRDYLGDKLERSMVDRIEDRRKSLLIQAANDIDIEVGLERLRFEKKTRELFSADYVHSLMDIFRLRDNVNLHFKNKFGFDIFRLEQEGVIPEIAKPCEIETDFVTKIALLGNLIDWMNVDDLKSSLKVEARGSKSITLLEEFLKQEFSVFDETIIKNLRIINELRNKKFPIHKEGEEVIGIFEELGEKYPPKDWGNVWRKVLDLYIDSLKNLIRLFQK